MTNLQHGGGQGYAVTVAVAGGGGTTVNGMVTTGIDAALATSVCSSLKSEACSQAEATPCESYGGSSSAAPVTRVPGYFVGLLVVLICCGF